MSSCGECNSFLKEFELKLWAGIASFNVTYCPKCKTIPTAQYPQFIGVSGKAQRGIDKNTGETRLKVSYPEDNKRDYIVKTFPHYRISQPSEWRYRKGKGIYKTKGRTAKVYPELKRGDELHVVGLWEEGIPLYSAMMHNSTVGITTLFIESEVQVKTRLFSSHTFKNPILEHAENLMGKLIE